jgi:dipeptidyl aminopeptidase/acylaminoacyl peptidase
MRTVLLLIMALLISAICPAQTPAVHGPFIKAKPGPNPPTPPSYIQFGELIDWFTSDALKSRLGKPQWLPDGSGILLPVRDKQTKKPYIHRVDFPGGQDQLLVPGFDPKPSPDGTQMAYVESGQLWLAGIDGSNPQQITNVPGSIASILGTPIAWSGDSKWIAFAYFNFQATPQYEIWLVEAVTGTLTLEYEAPFSFIASLSWLPDNERLVFATGDIQYSGASIVVYNLTTGESLHLAQGVTPETFALSPAPSPDSSVIAFQHDPLHKAVIQSADMALIPTDGGDITLLTQNGAYMNMPIYRPCWAPDGSGVYFQARRGFFNDEIAFASTTGQLQWIHLSPGQDIRGEFDVSPDGQRMAWLSEGPYGEEQLRVAKTDGTEEQVLLDVTPEVLAGRKFVAVEEVFWTSGDGLEVPGLLVRPADNKLLPAPLVVDVHGGPQAVQMLGGSSLLLGTPLEWQAWATLGYAVLAPSYRSDQFHGFAKWAEALDTQDFEAREFDDIASGVNHLVSQNIADPDRLVLYGHSAGGSVAQWATTTSDLFKAVVVKEGGSGDYVRFYEYLLQIGDQGFIDFYDWWFQGSLQQVPQNYTNRSPITYALNCVTPTMVLAGEKSDGLGGGGAAMHFVNALIPSGAEVIYIEYPGEGHVFMKPETLRHMIQHVVAFFEEKTSD